MATSSIMWVMADQAHVRVYEQAEPGRPLTRVDEFEQPEGALPSRRPLALEGMGSLFPGMRRARPRAVEPREEEARWFAGVVGRYIENARARGDFRELALVVHPGMLGLIWSQLSPETARRIRLSLGEDLMHLSEAELMERLSRTGWVGEQTARA
jgi:Protein required for attachment to host cells